MSDTNLDPSITALTNRASTVAVTATARELMNISRLAPSLEKTENTDLEVAINARAEDLAPTATATELKSIGKAIGNVLEPETFVAGGTLPNQAQNSGNFLATNGTAESWGGLSVSTLNEVNISSIMNDETLVYNHVSGLFENNSQVFRIQEIGLTENIPASGSFEGQVIFDQQTSELKYWDGSEWKVAAVVAAAGGAVGSGKLVIGAPFDDDNGDSSGSVYVYDAADLSAQPTKLIGELAGDRLGWSVALTSDKIIAGAQYHPMGPQSTTSRIGAVYAYDMNDLSAQPTKLVPSDVISSIDNPYHQTEFGTVIATSSDKIYIGHYKYPTDGIGEYTAYNVGAVFVYDANDLSADPIRIDNPETGQIWNDTLNRYLPAWENNEFGYSVAVSSNHLVVGTRNYGSYTPNDSTDAEANSGAVYVYDVNNLSAAPTKLTVSDGVVNDKLGSAVAVSSDVIVASALGYNSSSGSVYVWDANNLSAAPTKLVAFDEDPNDYFGNTIVISADKIFINVLNNTTTSRGAVYVYDVNNLSAAPTVMTASGTEWDQFGKSMSLISDKILIGARLESGGQGASYLYNLTDLSTPINTITAVDGAANDYFGYAVAMSEGSSASSGSGSTSSVDWSGSQTTLATLPRGSGTTRFGRMVVMNSTYVAVSDYEAAGDSFSNNGKVTVYLIADGSEVWSVYGQGDNFNMGYTNNGEKGMFMSENLLAINHGVNEELSVGGDTVKLYDVTNGNLIGSFSTAGSSAYTTLNAKHEFGRSISINNDETKIAIGAPVNTPDTGGGNWGRFYVYDISDLNNLSNTPIHTVGAEDLPASDPNTLFGFDLDFSGVNTLVVSAPDWYDGGVKTGKTFIFDLTAAGNGMQNSLPGKAVRVIASGGEYSDGNLVVVASDWQADPTENGLVKIWDSNSFGTATPTATINYPDGGANARFGHSTAFAGNYILVSGLYANTDTTGGGQIYVYNLDGTSVSQISSPNPTTWGSFGFCVAVDASGSGKWAVGATGEAKVYVFQQATS